MPRYAIKTTIDITRSNPNRDDPDPIRHAQQSNFNTLLQGIGMRSNVEWDHDPERIEEDETAYWIWEFDVERDEVFLEGDDPTGLLKKDLHGIPIIKNLTETKIINKPVFVTQGQHTNIWISQY